MAKKDVQKIVLAYSGGLDTSIILKWLKNEYGCQVTTFSADLVVSDGRIVVDTVSEVRIVADQVVGGAGAEVAE